MLKELTRTDLLVLGRFLDRSVNWGSMTNDSICSVLSGRFPLRSLTDTIKTLRKQGQIGPAQAQQNAGALGVDDVENDVQTSVLTSALQKVKPNEEHTGKLLSKVESLQLAFDKQQDLILKLRNEIAEIANRPAPTGSGVTVIENNISLPEFAIPSKLQAMRLHAAFEKTLRLVRAGLHVMLIGPAGSGKTTLASQIAAALQSPFYFQSMTAGTPESALTVRLLPLGAGGAMQCVASPFACGFAGLRNVKVEGGIEIVDDDERAGVCLLDEVDAADANTTLILNAALANGKMTIEALAASGRDPVLVASKRNRIMLSANTFGTGTDMQYAGRNALDAAFLDRCYPVVMGYDRVLEAHLARLLPPEVPQWQPAKSPTDGDWRRLARWVLDSRDKIEKAGIRKVWGTRSILKAEAALYAGIPADEIKRDLLAGWPHDMVVKLLTEDDV